MRYISMTIALIYVFSAYHRILKIKYRGEVGGGVEGCRGEIDLLCVTYGC